MKRGAALLIWVLTMAAAITIVARARYIADLSAFLPAKPTAMQQLLVDQLRDGPASRLILVAISGADAPTRARVASRITHTLRSVGGFSAVNDGEPVSAARDREFLFAHRYLLSDQVTSQRFSAAGLAGAIGATIEELASPAGLLMKALLASDPTGEMLHLIDQLDRSPGPRLEDGVWVDPAGRRALLLAQTQVAGSDTDGQERALAAIRAAFAAAVQDAGPAAGGLEIALSGPGVIAVAARARIKHAAMFLSLVSSALIVTLLGVVYRSATALLLGLLPVVTGALVGIAAVALVFGAVHGVTLGFGITLIGEAVDYSIYFFVQAHDAAARAGALRWRRVFWPTVRLGALTSVCGFASLLPSGFPGLAQLGLYSVTGLLAAAAVTRFVLPRLVPAKIRMRDLRPLGRWLARGLPRLRRFRAASWLLLGASLWILAGHRGDLWNRELSALSPVSAAELRLDADLRGALGAADALEIVVISGTDLEAVLQAAEQVEPALDGLVASHVIAGYDTPAAYLPSLAMQSRRRASLPAAGILAQRLQSATVALPVRPQRLEAFVRDVDAARGAAPLTARDLAGTSLEAGFDSLVLHTAGGWSAMLPLHAPATAGGTTAGGTTIDAARIRAALGGEDPRHVQVLDLKVETDALYAAYLGEAVRWSAVGFAAIVALLFVALRTWRRVARVLAPLLLAVATVAATLVGCGVRLTILHLVGMLLIVAVGSNYALFFDRSSGQPRDAALPVTLASIAVANATTVIGFGLLSFSGVPVLVALGLTVAPGAFLALIFSALQAQPRGAAHA